MKEEGESFRSGKPCPQGCGEVACQDGYVFQIESWAEPGVGAPAVDLDVQTRMVVVAVRNDTQSVLRIVPGNPELYVQTFDDKGKTLQLEQVKRLHVESTSLEGKVAGGEVAYFAIVYEAPILGAQQRLRVSVSQTEAADEPATTALRSGAERK